MSDCKTEQEKPCSVVVDAIPEPAPNTIEMGEVMGECVPTSSTTGMAQQGAQAVLTGEPLYTGCLDPNINAKFVVRGYQDVWAAVAFLIQLLVTIVWGFVTVGQTMQRVMPLAHNEMNGDMTDGSDFRSGDSTTGNGHVVLGPALLVFSGAVASSLGAAGLGLYAMRAAPRQFIIGSVVTTIVIFFAYGGLLMVKGAYGGGISSMFIGAVTAMWLRAVWNNIPLAASLLASGVTVTLRYKGMLLASLGSLIALCVYSVFFILTAVNVIMLIAAPQPRDTPMKNDDSPSDTRGQMMSDAQQNLLMFAITVLLLMFSWTGQVMANVVHVTASGTAATWYFAGPAAMPQNPSVASLKRALTTSFGSICFGSLLVALIKVLHTLARASMRQRNSFLACIAMCLMGCLERLMEYFNVYAFTHVAIYGSSFIEAAKQTWELVKNSGVCAIVNDNLVFRVFDIVIVFNSALLGVIFGFAADNATFGILVYFVSVFVHLIVYRVVYSTIVTLFVCFAESPQVLQTSNPQFYDELMSATQIAQSA